MSRPSEAAGPAPAGPADIAHMRAALSLARRALGNVWPNPAVGCVLVRPEASCDRVVGRGWTGAGGRPHGETEALARAGGAARGATAYVTLEPCAHQGKTPPCAEALIAAGISRVVAAVEDPDPRVSGRGIAALKSAGVETAVGVCAEVARAVNAGFFLRLATGRPLIALKLATSLDGRIATRAGESRWITGEAARARVHALRACHDAVAIGVQTALDDDPMLDCRLPGLGDRSPVRVVLDSGLRLPPAGRLGASAAQVPLWVVTVAGADAARRRALEGAGARIIEVAADGEGRPDAGAAFEALGAAGLTRVLVEGGGRLAASLLRAELVDRLYWFRAPRLIGDDGVPAVAALGVEALAQAAAFERVAVEPVGDDMLETYRRRP